MKKFYFLIIASAILLGLTAAYVFHCRSAHTEWTIRQTESWDLKKQELQSQIDDLSAKTKELKPQKTKLDVPELEPQVLIARLQGMKDWSELFGNNVPTNSAMKKIAHDQIREAYFVFQGLQDQGDDSLDAIRDYLANGHNVTLYRPYNIQDPNEYFDPEGGSSSDRYIVDRHVVMPETSRLGILQVLGNIKTPVALGTLCNVMQSTSDFRELTKAGNLLLVADRDTYADAVLAAYIAFYPNIHGVTQNELLASIKDISKDEYNKLVLDPDSFYGEDGKLRIDALYSRIRSLKEDAIPLASEIFNRADTSLKDKSDILIGLERAIYGYRGDEHKIDPANVEQVSSMYASFINGLSDEDKNTLGSMALMFYATAMGENDTERQQQYLNLIDQLPALQEEGSLFNETRDFMKNTISQMLKKGKDFGKDFDSAMAQKEMFDSGFPQKFMKSSLDFFKEHPEWKDSHFYKNFN